MFLTAEEKKINKSYLEKGYVIKDISDKSSLEWISNFFIKVIRIKNKHSSKQKFFNNIHRSLNISNLNDFRMNIINKINALHEHLNINLLGSQKSNTILFKVFI